MQTVRKTESEKWYQSEIDPDVEYLIYPPGNRLSSHAVTVNSEVAIGGGKPIFWGGDYTFDMVGFTLRDIKGMINQDGTPFKLEFKNRKVGKKTDIKRVTDECIAKLPTEIYHEIEKFAVDSMGITKPETENMDFTPGSCSQPTSSDAQTVTDVSPPADGSENQADAGDSELEFEA